MKLMRLVLLAAVCCAPGASANQGLTVRAAWVSEPPPGIGISAGYFVIDNHSNHDAVLVRVSSSRFAHVEMHLSQIREGLATMQPVDAVKIAVGASLSFAPGGYHLMLFNPAPPLDHREHIELVLHFADGTAVPVKAVVQRPEEAAAQLER